MAVKDPKFKDVAYKFTLTPVSMKSKEFTEYTNNLWGVMTKRLQEAGLIKEPATQPR
ncbi:MAG: hypothetical protein ABII06_18735 [Pseudomonadota bacterium]